MPETGFAARLTKLRRKIAEARKDVRLYDQEEGFLDSSLLTRIIVDPKTEISYVRDVYSDFPKTLIGVWGPISPETGEVLTMLKKQQVQTQAVSPETLPAFLKARIKRKILIGQPGTTLPENLPRTVIAVPLSEKDDLIAVLETLLLK